MTLPTEHLLVSELEKVELYENRLGAIGRTGDRIERLLSELSDLQTELEQLGLIQYLPGLSLGAQEQIHSEIELLEEMFVHLQSAAEKSYRQIILQREFCGFRGHEMVRKCFVIPERPALEDDAALLES